MLLVKLGLRTHWNNLSFAAIHLSGLLMTFSLLSVLLWVLLVLGSVINVLRVHRLLAHLFSHKILWKLVELVKLRHC